MNTLGLAEGQYKDPKYNIKRRPKIVNILVTYVPQGQIENCPARSNQEGGPVVLYDENKLDTIKFSLACHKYFKSGVDYEIVIVDNGSEDKETLEYLKTLEKEGMRVFHRKNIGFSFAGYKYAWEKLKDEYDYFFFTEQDCIPAKDNWLLEILQKFHSDKDVGIVGNNVEDFNLTEIFSELKTLCPYIKDRNWICNLDGFMSGFTSASILRQVDKIGGLFVLPVIGDKWAERNELIFQQPILELGYKIVSFNDDEHIMYTGTHFFDEHPEFAHLTIDKLTPVVLAHTRFFVLKEYFKNHGLL